MNKEEVETSKYLSYVLRHAPEAIGITLDARGSVRVDVLLAAAAANGRPIDRDVLMSAVANNDKKRFVIEETPYGPRIRAAQGHSTDQVSLDLPPKAPPEFLYHGTAVKTVAAIQKEGLRPMARHHVHLSADIWTASSVGARHGKPVIFQVEAQAMHKAGFEFYQADNGVWLSNEVPGIYLQQTIPDPVPATGDLFAGPHPPNCPGCNHNFSISGYVPNPNGYCKWCVEEGVTDAESERAYRVSVEDEHRREVARREREIQQALGE